MIESRAVPEPQKEKPTEEVKVEQPPDETPAIIPEPAVKPPEKVEEARPPAPVTAQRVKGGAPRIEPSWQSSLVRQLQRYKRYPSEAQSRSEEGVVLLSFSLDRTGHVLAHHILRSSGFADLDKSIQPEEDIGDDAPVVTVELAPIELDAGRGAARCRAGAGDHDRIKGRSRTAKGEADRRGEGRAAAG